MRGLSGLAGTGLASFSAVITTVALVALEKLQDQAEVARQKLEDLAKYSPGPPTTGAAEMAALRPAARQLGTTPEELAGPYGAALGATGQQALFLQGYPLPSREQLRAAAPNLVLGARADRATQEEATKGATAFFDEFQKSRGILTPEALAGLPVGEQDQLAKALLAQRGITRTPPASCPRRLFSGRASRACLWRRLYFQTNGRRDQFTRTRMESGCRQTNAVSQRLDRRRHRSVQATDLRTRSR